MLTRRYSHSFIRANLIIAKFKNRFIATSKSIKPQFNEDSHYSITDFELSIDISRYDDIMNLDDTSVSDTEYHSADSYSLNRSGPTSSVMEVN